MYEKTLRSLLRRKEGKEDNEEKKSDKKEDEVKEERLLRIKTMNNEGGL